MTETFFPNEERAFLSSKIILFASYPFRMNSQNFVRRRVMVLFRLLFGICSVDFFPVTLRKMFSLFIGFSQFTPHPLRHSESLNLRRSHHS